jgi:rhamnosyltransferase
METGIIIRTKNEQKWLGVVLNKLKEQSYQDFEIIIIDSGSTDNTLDIAKKYTKHILQIKQEEFSYPYALNIGCEHSVATKYLVMLSAHSIPISNTWLQDGIEDFEDEKVAGVYGNVWALLNATIWEKILFNKWIGQIEIKLNRKKIVTKQKMGVLGFTYAIIRKDLWDNNHFDEMFGAGGEDGQWARYYLSRGYSIIADSKFAVYHSHGLGFFDIIRQYKHWKSINKPQPFKKQKYRNNN